MVRLRCQNQPTVQESTTMNPSESSVSWFRSRSPEKRRDLMTACALLHVVRRCGANDPEHLHPRRPSEGEANVNDQAAIVDVVLGHGG